MTAPSPILVPGRTNTLQDSETLLPISIGWKSTGYPSNWLNQEVCPKIRECPPIPVSSPMVMFREGLIKDICMIWQFRPTTSFESGNCSPPTNTCSLIFVPSPISM